MHTHGEEYTSQDLDSRILYLANSMDEESYRSILALAAGNKNVIPAFGIHPARAAECRLTPGEIDRLVSQNDLVGEIGLDYFWEEDKSTYGAQEKVLRHILESVKKHGALPTLHTKGAEETILGLLKEYDISRCLIHWYSGPEKLIDSFLDQGCYFTLGPDILADSRLYKSLPPDRIFLETDNPTGMPWVTGRPEAADDIISLYAQLARHLNLSLEVLQERIRENIRSFLLPF